MVGIASLACVALAGAPQASPAAGGAPAPEVLFVSDHPERIVAHSQSWGLLGIDTCAHAQGQQPLPLEIGERNFAKGLGSHANGEILLDLGGAFARFEAEVGVQKQGGTAGSVVFSLLADDEELWRSPVLRPSDGALAVSVAVAGCAELCLVATDAGDGIICDCADWGNARLVRAREPAAVKPWPRTDVAPFAAVRSWNWKESEGTRAGRLDDFPAADLEPWSEPARDESGRWRVAPLDGFACVGLEWSEPRRLARLELASGERPEVAPRAADGVRVEQWLETEGGGSTWQGKWAALPGAVRVEGDRLVVEPNSGGGAVSLSGTTKVRWIVPAAEAAPLCVRQLVALSRSRFRDVELLLTAERPTASEEATIELWNGSRRDGGRGAVGWPLIQPLRLPITACTSRHAAGDRTVLRVAIRSMKFGVAVDDVLAHGGVWVADAGLYVTDAAKPVALAEYRKRFEGATTVLQEARERPEQALPAATSHLHHPEQDRGPTLISLPADNRKFIVERDGTIRWDDRPAVYDAVDAPPAEGDRCAAAVRFGEKREPPNERELADLSCLGLELKRSDGALHYAMKFFVAPPEIGDLRLSAENGGGEAADAAIEVRFTHPAGVRAAPLEYIEPPAELHFADVEVDRRVMAWATCGKESSIEILADGVIVHARLAPHAKAQARVVLPRWSAEARDFASVPDVNQAHLEAQRAWQGFLAETAQFDLPDPELDRIAHASMLHCLAAARTAPKTVGGGDASPRIAPWIASVSYGPLESEAQSVLRGMQSLGAKSFAAAGHRYFSDKIDADGRLTTGYTLIGTGWHLWTLGEYDALFEDDALMRSLAPATVRACRWIMAQRRKGTHDGGGGDSIRGLMPPGPLADWNRFARYFYANANACAGLRDAAAALTRIGDPNAAEIAADAKAFRDDILKAWHAASARAPVVPLRDGRFVAYFPSDADGSGPTETFHPGEDAGRSWCYDVEVGPLQMVALGLVAPNAREADWIVDQLEDVQYLRDGWFAYPAAENAKDPFDCGGFAKVQPYYARTTESHALRDDPVAFIRSYINTIPTLLNREDLSLWEHFAANGAWNKTHETGYLLYQTRTLLLTEREEELWLAPFAPRAWFADGKHISISNAPTRFGPAGYSITSFVGAKKGGHRIEATIDPPTRHPPAAIVLRLRHPDRAPIQSVTVDGQECLTFDAKDGTIWIETKPSRIAVRADY
jgi:NPCBM/NEW2 domain-containing protein